VVVSYVHDQRRAEETVGAILASGGAAELVRADVSDELDVERLFAETIASCGGVDAVVQAVMGRPVASRALAEAPLEEFDALSQVGNRAGFLVIREAARHLRVGGAVVNFTSLAVTRPRQHTTVEAAGRAAVDVLTRTAALELAGRDITVNAIALDYAGPCEPEHVVDAVVYLLSDAARGAADLHRVAVLPDRDTLLGDPVPVRSAERAACGAARCDSGEAGFADAGSVDGVRCERQPVDQLGVVAVVRRRVDGALAPLASADGRHELRRRAPLRVLGRQLTTRATR
jgi:3-oxoacyl-[acyl-carrier protein] reductase